MSENEWIGRSIINCLIHEAEEEARICGYPADDEVCNIKLFFDAMADLGIKRVHEDVYHSIISTVCDTGDIDYYILLEDAQCESPDLIEFGEPEKEIECNHACVNDAEIYARYVEKTPVGKVQIAIAEFSVCAYREYL